MSNSYLRAAVGAFIVNELGELLLVLKHGYLDKWDTFKGGIDQGESDIQALARELEEELHVSNYEILEKSRIPLIRISPTVDWNTTTHLGQGWRSYWLRVSSKEFTPKVPSEEIEQVKWIKITPDEIRTHLKEGYDEGVLETFLPIEWLTIKATHFPSLSNQ
jgi:8-oxo-dGTP pyrophosphatase MutT (NUDIX family)